MKRCAFLTLADRGDFVIDDELAEAPLRDLGWEVTSIPWTREDVHWRGLDAVVVRSTWDYQRSPVRFLEALKAIAATGVPLFNSLERIRWNVHKEYLLELEEAGLPVVPTVVRPGLRAGESGEIFEALDAEEVVVKPELGAGAEGAFRVRREAWDDRADEIQSYFSGRPLLAQPFVSSVTEEGEWSLIYFNGAYSHGILKIPASGDFRTQEEFGSEIRPVRPSEPLRHTADRILDFLSPAPLYARVDLVRAHDPDVFWLMELELIEPSLYLRTDSGAPTRFATALDEAHREIRGAGPAARRTTGRR